jgi:hypothetical protein
VRKICSILGLPSDSSKVAVDAVYNILMDKLAEKNFPPGSQASGQAAQCRWAIEQAYSNISKSDGSQKQDNDDREQSIDPEAQMRPRLGQMCVASGMISMKQLQEAVEAQIKEGLPLGEVLQAKRFISQAELDGLLLGQQMIDVPSACVDPIGLRLISLGLVSEDMVFVTQMEQKALGESIGDLLVRRGWVDRQVLAALANDPEAC